MAGKYYGFSILALRRSVLSSLGPAVALAWPIGCGESGDGGSLAVSSSNDSSGSSSSPSTVEPAPSDTSTSAHSSSHAQTTTSTAASSTATTSTPSSAVGPANSSAGVDPSDPSDSSSGGGASSSAQTETSAATTSDSVPTGSGETPPDGPAPVLSGLQVEANPTNVLSCIVSWTTDVDANSEVRFGQGSYQFVIRDNTPTKEHRVLVIGMRAQLDYMLQAVSSTTGGSAQLEDTFTTGTLPNTVSRGTAVTDDAAAATKGWTLTNLMPGNGPAVAVMYDMDGEPVWYYVNGNSTDARGDVSVDLLEDNHILIGPAPGQPPREIDLEGNVIWEGPSQQGMDQMTHHAGKISNGNYGIIRDVRDQQAGLQGSQLDEVTKDNEVVWSWNIFDHLTPGNNSNMDWCHANSATFDLDNDVVYLNCRFLGIIKIQYSTKEVLWHMGGTFDQTKLGDDFTFMPANGQFSDAHHPKYFPDEGRILLYDNGGFSQAGGFGGSATDNFRSRVLEYAVDETAMTATVEWEFPGAFQVDSWYTDEWYSPYWGDVDRLPNGNLFIDGAIRSASKKARIFEVTRDGAVLWHMELPTNIGTYRADRLSPPPLVEELQ